MKVGSFHPPRPKREITLTFPDHEGWALVAAIREYAANHEGALHRSDWVAWASELDAELRR